MRSWIFYMEIHQHPRTITFTGNHGAGCQSILSRSIPSPYRAVYPNFLLLRSFRSQCTFDLIAQTAGTAGREMSLSRFDTTCQSKLTRDAFHSVGAIDVLDQRDLEAGRATLSRDDGGVCQEVFPDPEPSSAVLRLDFVLVRHPVPVPPPQSRGIVHTHGIHALDFETSPFELVDHEAQRRRSIGAREDVLVHEEPPNQIFVLPCLSQTSNLEEKDAVIVKHVVNLGQERAEMANTNMLRHFQASYLLVAATRHGDVSVVHAKNITLVFRDASLSEAIVPPSGLIASKGDASRLSIIIDRGIFGKSSPAASNIKHFLPIFETDLLADHSKLVILQLLQCFLSVDIADDSRSVNHAWAEKPSVEIITTVVMVTNLFFIFEEQVSDTSHMGLLGLP